jgi:hypothetical protein
MNYSAELCYNILKRTIFCIVITGVYNVMVNSEEIIGITEYLTL